MRLEAFLSLLFNSCFIQACICDSLRTGTDEHEENCRKQQTDEGMRGATHRVLMSVVCPRAKIEMSKDTNHDDDFVEFSVRFRPHRLSTANIQKKGENIPFLPYKVK